jgi:hypothetical protein
MDFKNTKTTISFPLELIENKESFPLNHAIPCSVLVNDEEIGGIFIPCSSQTIEYFKIKPPKAPEPPLKFRMMNFQEIVYIVEIWMLFNQKPEKYLKIHLNPHDKSVQKLLKLGAETNIFSFHFYDTKTRLISTAITGLNHEEKEWFNRNHKLSSKLYSDMELYESLAENLRNKITGSDRIFNYHRQNKYEFFVRDGGKQVVL